MRQSASTAALRSKLSFRGVSAYLISGPIACSTPRAPRAPTARVRAGEFLPIEELGPGLRTGKADARHSRVDEPALRLAPEDEDASNRRCVVEVDTSERAQVTFCFGIVSRAAIGLGQKLLRGPNVDVLVRGTLDRLLVELIVD
jgi:hypothetical protein